MSNQSKQPTIKIDGKTYAITTPVFRFKKEVYTAEEAVENPELVKEMLEINAANVVEIFPEVNDSENGENKEKAKPEKNSWPKHLAKVREENPGMSYKEVQKLASETFKKTP